MLQVSSSHIWNWESCLFQMGLHSLWRNRSQLLKPSLYMKEKVVFVMKSVYHLLWLLHQLQFFIDKGSLATHALVTSCLDYGNVLYVGLPLQLVGDCNFSLGGEWCPLLGPRKLHWLPVRYQARLKVLLPIYKALGSSGSSYLKDQLPFHYPVRALRSADGT